MILEKVDSLSIDLLPPAVLELDILPSINRFGPGSYILGQGQQSN